MMIDMHEQALTQALAVAQEESALVPMDESRLARAKNWWGQLRGNDEADFSSSKR
jgi:hypothetical protein